MSTFKIDRYRQDGRTLLLSTHKSYSSSSSGVTGSVQLGARTSKNIRDLGSYTSDTTFSDATAASAVDALMQALSSTRSVSTNVSTVVNRYMNSARSVSREDQRSSIVFSPKVYTFDPAAGDDVLGSDYSVRKYARRMISGSLVPAYATENQGKFFAVGNYFTHNFFTSNSVRSDSAYVFPNFDGAYPSYAVSKGLTIDLHLNPRYSSAAVGSAFTAGTIVHVPGCYSLSLVTGSSKGPDGLPDKFRLVLSLMHSADVSPSVVDLDIANGSRAYPQDLTYVCDNNAIARNTWNHISVSWSNTVDAGVGTFWLNGREAGQFKPHRLTIYPGTRPDALIVGNHVGTSTPISRLFNTKAATNEGLLENSAYASGDPAVSLTNPLNAEIHSLKVYEQSISPEMRTNNGLTDSTWRENGLIFYMPPVFMHESPVRQVPVSLFEKRAASSTTSPINVDLMFGVGGRDINLENFVRDITRFGRVGAYPRLLNLTSSLKTSYDSSERNFNNIFYADAINRKRNLSVLPNDDGSFRLTYQCISSLTGVMSGSFKSYGGSFDYSQIDLTSLTAHYSATTPMPKGKSRTDPGASTTQDAQGTNYYQVQYEDQETCLLFGSLIDISTIHYGHRVKPGSFVIADYGVSGSGNRVGITLKEDKRNGLYRADALTEHAHWNTQGLFYGNEGIGLVLAPTLPFFGKDTWKIELDTDASAHVFTMDVVVPEAAANVSQSPSYISFPPTTGSDEVAKNFVYIDTINVHDENLNVVARATLAQPILKRPNEEFLFRLKLDY